MDGEAIFGNATSYIWAVRPCMVHKARRLRLNSPAIHDQTPPSFFHEWMLTNEVLGVNTILFLCHHSRFVTKLIKSQKNIILLTQNSFTFENENIDRLPGTACMVVNLV